MLKIIKHFFFISAFCFTLLGAQTKYSTQIKTQDVQLPFGLTKKIPANLPKIGLALSGGGSRGIAQLGVLKALEANNIPFDIIVGTSMGSIIGGLYSAGYSLAQLDSILRSVNWEEMISITETSRRDLFIDKKITEDREVFSIRFDGLRPIIPTSLSSGQKVMNFLNLLTISAPLYIEENFDELLFDYYAVSTDLITGNQVILDNGSLSRAMRSSSSVTFLLAPVKLDSALLVDGGLVANVPVNVAHKIGADYIIAVNTTSKLRREAELIYPWLIADQIVSIPMNIITEQNLDNADVIIEPYLGDRKNNDFSNMQEMIEMGYGSVEPHLNSIRRKLKELFIDNFNDSLLFVKKLTLPENPSQIELDILNGLNGKDSVSNAEILYELTKNIDLNDYKDLSLELIDKDDATVINVNYVYNNAINEIKFFGVHSYPELLEYEFNNDLLGKPFNSRRLTDYLLKILRKYKSNGFSLAKIESIDFDEISGDLFIYFSEGIINNIYVEGNSKTNSDVILREFDFKQGNVFKYEILRQGLENLRNTNLFDEIDINIESSLSGSNITINVTEKLTTILRFGIKIDNEYFTQFLFDLREENLFGTGTELGSSIFIGSRNRFYTLEHKASRIYKTYLNYKLVAFYKSDDITSYADSISQSKKRFFRIKNGQYKQKSYGLNFGLGAQVEKFGNVLFEFRKSKDEISNLENIVLNPFIIDIAALRINLRVDSQDRIPYPKEGFLVNGFYETAQTSLGGDVSYTKFYFDYKSFFTFDDLHTLILFSSIGFGDETLPISQQFSFGGQYNFLGYREYDTRGRQIFVSSLQYRLKLPFKLFFDTYVKAIYDLGSIWKEKGQIKFEALRHGVGFTLSFETPIGPADFSIGKSFIIREEPPKTFLQWGDTKLYFTIGYYY